MTVARDGFDVVGGAPLAGGAVRSFGDHRIAMAFAVAALCCAGPVAIDDFDCVAKSYPGFRAALAHLLGSDAIHEPAA